MLQNQLRDIYSISFLVHIQTFWHPLGWQHLHIQLLINYKHSMSPGYLKCLSNSFYWLIDESQRKLVYEHHQGVDTIEGLPDHAVFWIWKSLCLMLACTAKYDQYMSPSVCIIYTWISFFLEFSSAWTQTSW